MDLNKVPKGMAEAIILQEAMDRYGEDSQISQTMEELAELIVKLNHWRRSRVGKTEVIKEMVDVSIMINQLKVVFGDKAFNICYDNAIEDLRKRLVHET